MNKYILISTLLILIGCGKESSSSDPMTNLTQSSLSNPTREVIDIIHEQEGESKLFESEESAPLKDYLRYQAYLKIQSEPTQEYLPFSTYSFYLSHHGIRTALNHNIEEISFSSQNESFDILEFTHNFENFTHLQSFETSLRQGRSYNRLAYNSEKQFAITDQPEQNIIIILNRDLTLEMVNMTSNLSLTIKTVDINSQYDTSLFHDGHRNWVELSFVNQKAFVHKDIAKDIVNRQLNLSTVFESDEITFEPIQLSEGYIVLSNVVRNELDSVQGSSNDDRCRGRVNSSYRINAISGFLSNEQLRNTLENITLQTSTRPFNIADITDLENIVRIHDAIYIPFNFSNLESLRGLHFYNETFEVKRRESIFYSGSGGSCFGPNLSHQDYNTGLSFDLTLIH